MSFSVALANLQKTETELKSKLVEKKHELEGFVTKVKENQQKIRHWKKEVGIAVLNHIGPMIEYYPRKGQNSRESKYNPMEDVDVVDTSFVPYTVMFKPILFILATKMV